MSHESADYAPLEMGKVSATDVVLLRPPTAVWGYSMQITEEALDKIANAIRERDVRIIALEQRISDLTGQEHYAPRPPGSTVPGIGLTRVAPPPPVPRFTGSATVESPGVADPLHVTPSEGVQPPDQAALSRDTPPSGFPQEPGSEQDESPQDAAPQDESPQDVAAQKQETAPTPAPEEDTDE